MKIAIYGNKFQDDFEPYFQKLTDILLANKTKLTIYKPFFESLKQSSQKILISTDFFATAEELKENADILLSIGGDGTFLDSVTFVQNSGIPIAGINSGRLGFLANISRDEIELAMDKILKNSYSFEERELLQLLSPGKLFGDCNFALNEITITKKDSSSMITIQVYLNGHFLNTYWSDGLIIATPTGSTAYSLSVGGPIVVPDARNFIITPIAPHNLTVRPLVLPNNQELTLKIQGRDENYLVSLDRRYETLPAGIELKIKKARFKIKVIKYDSRTFFGTLREKLMWGLDKRN
jgi:NAD+ kinase